MGLVCRRKHNFKFDFTRKNRVKHKRAGRNIQWEVVTKRLVAAWQIGGKSVCNKSKMAIEYISIFQGKTKTLCRMRLLFYALTIEAVKIAPFPPVNYKSLYHKFQFHVRNKTCCFTPTVTQLIESTLIDQFTMTTQQQGSLVKCDSYVTAYQQQTDQYAISSREVAFSLSLKFFLLKFGGVIS